MAQEYQIVRIIPDKKGKGGDKSGMTTHMGVVDIFSNINALLYAGRWRSMRGSVAYTTGLQNNANASHCNTVHVYYQYSTSSTAEPSIFLFGHQVEYLSGNHDVLWNYTGADYLYCFKSSTVYTGTFTHGANAITGISPAVYSSDAGRKISIWGFNGTYSQQYRSSVPLYISISSLLMADVYGGTSGTYSFVMAQRVVNTAGTSTGIAKFVNVRSRCFIAWGNAYWGNLIADSSFVTPSGSSTIAYPMGVPAPVGTLQYTLTTGLSTTVGFSSNPNFSNLAGLPSTSGLGSLPVQMVANGVTYTISAYQSPNFSQNFVVGADNTYSTALPPGANKITAGTIVFNTPSFATFCVLATVSISTGGNVVGTIDRYVAPGTYFAGYSIGAGICATVTISPAYTGTDAIGVPASILTSNMTWTGAGPTYAVARYNPTTGHVSNIGPLMQVTEQNISAVSVNLTIPVDGVASDWYQAGYTRLIVFRSQFTNAGGGTLYPIGDPTVDGNAATYPFGNRGTIANFNVTTPMIATTLPWADIYPDTVLLAAPTFNAPQAINNPPPTFTQMAYWDSCLWGVDIADQTAIRRSGFGVGEIPFGVAEESYPSQDQLRLPAEDGRVLGMKPVGASLIVTTQRYAYAVTGAQGQYGLVRFCTAMYGVTHERFCEWAGDAGESSDRLAFIGNDGKLYRFTPDYGTEVVSAPIATTIDAMFPPGIDLTPFRIHQLISKSYRLFIFVLGSAIWALDYENGTWHLLWWDYHNYPEAFAQIYSGASSPIQLYGNQGAVYKWFDETIANYWGAVLTTFTIDGGSPETFKELCAVRLWISDGTKTPNGTVYSDEGVSLHGEARTIPLSFQAEPDPVRSPQNIQTVSTKLDSSNAAAVIAWVGKPFVGHRFYLTFGWGDSAQYDVYAIDFFFKPVEGQPTG